MSIPKDKKDKIYEAALKEFCKYRYKGASTNNIIKEAKISKGALFKYFGSKLNLYVFVVEEAMEKYQKEIKPLMKDLPKDMFDRIIINQSLKMEVALKMPREAKIITESYLEEDEEIKERLSTYYGHYEQAVSSYFFSDIDTSKFKEGIDPKLVYKTILYISYGFKEELKVKYNNNYNLILQDKDNFMKDVLDSINLIRRCVYK